MCLVKLFLIHIIVWAPGTELSFQKTVLSCTEALGELGLCSYLQLEVAVEVEVLEVVVQEEAREHKSRTQQTGLPFT